MAKSEETFDPEQLSLCYKGVNLNDYLILGTSIERKLYKNKAYLKRRVFLNK